MADFATRSVVLTGEDGVLLRIDGIQRRATHPGISYWNKVGAFVRNAYAQQFRTDGAFLGTPWKPLKPRSVAWKLKQGYGRRGILVADGALRDSYTRKQRSVQNVFDSYADFGSENDLAIFHQRGTHSHKTGKPLIPARPVVVVNTYIKEGVKRITADYIAGKKLEPDNG